MATHLKTPLCAVGTYESSEAAGFQFDLQTGPYAEPGGGCSGFENQFGC